jgi:hypothetical protein
METIKAGAKIRNARSEKSPYGWHGTFGCLVRSRDDPSSLFILSAAHVVALNGYAEPGDVVEAEYPPGTDQWVEIGKFERAYRWYDSEGVQQLCDAALTRVTNATRISAEIEDIGVIKQISTDLYEGMRLKFRGAGTGNVAFAKLLTFGAGTKALYRDFSNGNLFQLDYANQILYVQENNAVPTSPTMPMDSGALVLTEDNQPIGMHFARTPDDYPVNAAVCTPLQTILSALDVELVTAQTPSPQNAAIQPASLDDIGISAYDAFDVLLRLQMEPHTIYGGANWYLSKQGLIIDNKLDRSPGTLVTVPRLWNQYAALILQAAIDYRVPVELIMATICTESSGKVDSIRTEPKWISDEQTPDQISAGLMQTLISTARSMLPNETISRTTLCDPKISITAGTAYISHQRQITGFDPPVVACAYNAGKIELNDSTSNRWRMRQYPIGSSTHADRFVQWFNDCFTYLASNPALLPQQTVSLVQLMRG